jgi:TPR repeat protein
MGSISSLAVVVMCLASVTEAQTLPDELDAPAFVVRADFVFDNAVRKTNDLPTDALRASRRQMIAGEELGIAELRALADAGDGLAAFRYAKLLEERGTPDLSGAAAHYYAIAAYTGRAFAVPPLARLLKSGGVGYGAARLTDGLNAMTVQALSGNPEAATLLGQMYANGVPFGRDLAKAQLYLGMAKEGGSPQAILKLGVALMSDPADAATGHVGARSALTLAAQGEDLSVRITAENLLRLIDTMPSPKPEVTQ